jgi:hypothetical protein
MGSLKRIPKKPIRDPAVLKRMEIAFALAEAAEQMKRMNLRRQSPEATEEEIVRAIREWYAHRPGSASARAPEESQRAWKGLFQVTWFPIHLSILERCRFMARSYVP